MPADVREAGGMEQVTLPLTQATCDPFHTPGQGLLPPPLQFLPLLSERRFLHSNNLKGLRQSFFTRQV